MPASAGRSPVRHRLLPRVEALTGEACCPLPCHPGRLSKGGAWRQQAWTLAALPGLSSMARRCDLDQMTPPLQKGRVGLGARWRCGFTSFPRKPVSPISSLVCPPAMTLRTLPAVEVGPQAPGRGSVLSTFVCAGSFWMKVVKSLLVGRAGSDSCSSRLETSLNSFGPHRLPEIHPILQIGILRLTEGFPPAQS